MWQRLGLVTLRVCDCYEKSAAAMTRDQDDQTEWLLREGTDKQLATHLYGPDDRPYRRW
jgi:hypothetical protein